MWINEVVRKGLSTDVKEMLKKKVDFFLTGFISKHFWFVFLKCKR